jgi:hypothetical protein
MIDVALITIWAAITTIIIIMFNTAGTKECGGEIGGCRFSLWLLGVSVCQNALCSLELIQSAEGLADQLVPSLV